MKKTIEPSRLSGTGASLRAVLLFLTVMLCSVTVSAQTTISGHVKDSAGEDVIGASVIVKGTQNGTITDFDGNFSVKCELGVTLVVSYIGYNPQEVKAKDGMEIVLSEDVAQLNEVVVVGYGSLSKKEISSSVVQINKDQFNQGAASDPMALIAGNIAGVNVNATADANPNAMSDFQIRGATSINSGNGPLIVIDGVAGGDLRNVAAQDVESITVLKDAGSAAIYGTRGANGVVLVTTKKGSGAEGVLNVTYDSYVALNIAKPHLKVMDADEWRRSRRGTDYGASTDWYDEITRGVAYNVNQYVSIDGSTKNGYYGASLNFKQGNGLDRASGRKEYGGRFVLEQRALDKRLQFNTSLSARKVHEDYGNDGMFDTALALNPTMPVRNPDGSYYQPSHQTGIMNPVEAVLNRDNNGDRMYVLGNADVKLNILRSEMHNLSTSLSYALQHNDYKTHYYAPIVSGVSYWNSYKGSANINYQKWWTDRLEWLGNYTLSLQDHELKAVVGYSWERNRYEQHREENFNFDFDQLSYWGIGSGSYLKDGKANMSAYKSENTLIGFFGRLNYNWKDMLYLSASLRYEGSTKFGADHKWGAFPSVSAAWELTNTSFLKEQLSPFQSLKLRTSFGVTGRQPDDAYKSLALYAASGTYFDNGKWINAYKPVQNANPDLKWEKSQAFNIGVDFVTLNSHLRGSIEYFDRRSKDLLYTYTAPQPPYVYPNILVNVGSIKNNGFEVSLDYDVFHKTPVRWTTGVNYSYSTTKLTKLSSGEFQASYLDLYQKPGVGTSEYFFRVEEGGKIGQFYGYEYAGHDANGNMLVYNKNGVPVLTGDATPDDKRNIGNGAPNHFLSWNNTVSYKHWDLSCMFSGTFGFDIFNMNKYGMGLQGCGTDNVLRTAYTEDRDVRTGGGVISSYFLEKGDYFKLDNVTVGYTFPLKNKKILEFLRVYMTAKNIFTITGYSGHDPSTISTTGITPGVDLTSAYPNAIQVSMGVTLKFH